MPRQPTDEDAELHERLRNWGLSDAMQREIVEAARRRHPAGLEVLDDHLFYEEALLELQERVAACLQRHPESYAGADQRSADGRTVVRALVTGDVEAHSAALASLGTRVVVEVVPRTVAEKEAIVDRMEDDRDALAAAGYEVIRSVWDVEAGVLVVSVFGGSSAMEAPSELSQRYGSAVRADWRGPSPVREMPLKARSCSVHDDVIDVRFDLNLNGQRFGGVCVDETDDRVVVALTMTQPLGYVGLKGGRKAGAVRLKLGAPLRDRPLLDAYDSCAIPLVSAPQQSGASSSGTGAELRRQTRSRRSSNGRRS